MAKDKDTSFSFSSKFVACTLGIVGIICIVISLCWDTEADTISRVLKVGDELLSAVGQTLAGSCAISLLLELSTLKSDNAESVKKGCIKVVDTLYGANSGYLTGLSTDINIQSRMQLVASMLNQEPDGYQFDVDYLKKSALHKFENCIMDSLLIGIIADEVERKIHITPISSSASTVYRIKISEYHKLILLNDDACSHLRDHRFRFISKKQNESFHLQKMIVNGIDYKDSLDDYVEKSDSLNKTDVNAVGNRVFDYLTTVHLPKQPKSLRTLEYKIEYVYENYERGTYLTSSLNYPTYNIKETYSLIGENIDNYIIHGFSHFPYHSNYKKKMNIDRKKIYAGRSSSSVIHIEIVNDWQLPGSGSSVVVREKTHESEILD